MILMPLEKIYLKNMNYKDELEKIYNAKSPIYDNLDKEIVLYGAGSLGHMGLDLLKKSGILPKYIVDKNKSGEIDGVEIIAPDEIPLEDKKEKLFLVCISTIPYNDIVDFLISLGIKNILQFYTYAYIKFPKLLSNGWFVSELTEADKENIDRVCEILSHDETSIHHYLQFLWWKLRGIEKIYEGFPVLSGKKYFKTEICKNLKDNEILLDVGCHFGQTIESFSNITNNKYKEIVAIEPDKYNLEICKNKFNDKRIKYLNIALSDKKEERKFIDNLGYASKLDEKGNTIIQTETIDSLNLKPTIIKLHTEGEELNILKGASETIKAYKPKLMVLADHNDDGLYKIPLLMYNYGYKLYFNLHDYCGNTAVFYGG